MTHEKPVEPDLTLNKPEETMRRLKISRRYLSVLLSRGELEGLHLGRALRITKASEDAFLTHQRQDEANRRPVQPAA